MASLDGAKISDGVDEGPKDGGAPPRVEGSISCSCWGRS
jgi:hypothetical protein